MKNLKFVLMLTSSILFSQVSDVKSAEEYNNLTCVVGLRTEQLCNIAIHKRSMVIKFPTGRTEIIKLHKIGKWGYTNESKLKGFIFTWVKHRHVFGIANKNIDGDKEQARAQAESDINGQKAVLGKVLNNVIKYCI